MKKQIHRASKPLDRRFYARDTVQVAKDLLGTLLVHTTSAGLRTGIIVETEAYCGLDDPASHACRNRAKRNIPMFGPVGHAYVYFIYGNHHCFNVVAKNAHQEAGGVLIRAVEPIDGLHEMLRSRDPADHHNVSNGPGKLTQAFGITRKHNNIDLIDSETLFIARHKQVVPESIKCSSRIGIRAATDKQWRFYIAGNPWVSYYKNG